MSHVKKVVGLEKSAESANICEDKELTFSKYDTADRARGRISFYLPLKKITLNAVLKIVFR